MERALINRFIFTIFLSFSLISTLYAGNPDLTKKLQTLLDKSMSHSSTPGAVLLISEPSMGTIAVASGYANLKTHTPMRVDSNFRIASMSKTFLAIEIFKLISQKKLSLNQKISELLPDSVDINRIPNGESLTVKQLMQMRSGIPDYVTNDAYLELLKKEPDHEWKPEETIAFIYDEDPNFSPGKKFEYSNTNFVLLQMIVEEITGTSYAAQLRKDIFDPLHLSNTYVEILEERNGGFQGLLTHGYELEDDKLKDVTTINDALGLGDGGIISTAQDMSTFVQALLQNKTVLPADSLKLMLEPSYADDYALGIYREEVDSKTAWTHNGQNAGFSGQYYYFPESKVTMVILTNMFDADILNKLPEKTMQLLDE